VTIHAHISQEYEAELAGVRDRLLDMGRHVDEVLDSAGRALSTRDARLANQIILGDQETDTMELEIDNRCLETLARRQPVADDLRLLTSAMKLVIELERIGDLGVSIAARVVELVNEPPLTGPDDLIRMLLTAREMLSEAMGALETESVERATRAIAKDDVVDGYYTQIFNDVLSRMRENPDNIYRATRIQAISKYIERIGDHATNVAERVIFILTGEEIRHLPRVRRGDLS
jgi:phosphate transport system protein